MNLLLLAVLAFPVINGKLAIPFGEFLLQEPAFEVDSAQDGGLPTAASVPLVMRILFEEADRVSNQKALPQGGDFQSLARSVRPTKIQQLGPQRVVLDLPQQATRDVWPGAEVWLVFQLRQSHIQGYNCSQVLSIYKNEKPLVSVPLDYSTADPLLAVNVTGSLSRRYTVIIKDSTSYTHDRRLFSFANYIDCSLAWTSEVLELNSHQSSPVLLILSPELAAEKLLGSKRKERHRRRAEYSEETTLSEEIRFGESGVCQMREWVVNVQQLGWDWLIYPEQIPLNLCVGMCPELLERRFNATSHAVARGLYRLVLGQEAMPENTGPCCVPVKYRRFTMLIEKSPGIISLETSSDLSAAHCGCR